MHQNSSTGSPCLVSHHSFFQPLAGLVMNIPWCHADHCGWPVFLWFPSKYRTLISAPSFIVNYFNLYSMLVACTVFPVFFDNIITASFSDKSTGGGGSIWPCNFNCVAGLWGHRGGCACLKRKNLGGKNSANGLVYLFPISRSL